MLPLLCIVMLLITFALATWALVEGVRGTHHRVDDFWGIEQSVRDQVSPRSGAQAETHVHLCAAVFAFAVT